MCRRVWPKVKLARSKKGRQFAWRATGTNMVCTSMTKTVKQKNSSSHLQINYDAKRKKGFSIPENPGPSSLSCSSNHFRRNKWQQHKRRTEWCIIIDFHLILFRWSWWRCLSIVSSPYYNKKKEHIPHQPKPFTSHFDAIRKKGFSIPGKIQVLVPCPTAQTIYKSLWCYNQKPLMKSVTTA